MAGLSAHHRSSASLASKILLLLTALPLFLASLAFLLQWRGGVDDLASRWTAESQKFPGKENSSHVGSTVPSTTSGDLPSSSSECVEILGQSSFPSFPYFRGWNFSFESDPHPKISIVSTTSASLEQILPWLFYHKVIGVTQFFLFVEGKAANPHVSAVLESITGVKLVHRTKHLVEKQAQSRIWNETWLAGFFYKPCNYELFVKQTLNMEMAIVMAREAGMDWILHLDTDELMHPAGAQEYSLRQLLLDVPSHVDMVIFPNYESCVKRDDIKDPFSEVFMFKKNYDHLPKDTYFAMYKEATRCNPNYFLTYGNGKSAARIQDHLRPNGAHRWHNYMKTPNEVKLEEAAVLHFTYTKFSDLTSRRDRCSCKPTKDDVKRCYMLSFDRDDHQSYHCTEEMRFGESLCMNCALPDLFIVVISPSEDIKAFIIASTATPEEMLRWYNEHVVWRDEEVIIKLLKKGVLTHIYAPMAIIQGLRESGVFSSAIASAQTLSKDKSLTTGDLQNKNSSTLPNLTIGASIATTRGAGGNESLAAARKILETIVFTENAIRPTSPPGLDDIQIET